MAEKMRYKFADSPMFSWVLTQDKTLCAEVIGTLLGTEVEELELAEPEASEVPAPPAKIVRLDVRAKGSGAVYDVEMQIAKRSDLRRRARYYQAAMDVSALDRSGDYGTLPENYVVFICMGDFLGKGVTGATRCARPTGRSSRTAGTSSSYRQRTMAQSRTRG